MDPKLGNAASAFNDSKYLSQLGLLFFPLLFCLLAVFGGFIWTNTYGMNLFP